MPTTVDLNKLNLDPKFQEIFNKLNPAQQKAVTSTEGPVMVLAGPGTGKTQVLASRIAYILGHPDLQMSPENILCLTFTESGVTAMRERLNSFIGSAAYYVKIHTFHSFCNEIILDNPGDFPLMKSIKQSEQMDLIKSIIDKLDTENPLKPFRKDYLYVPTIISKIQSLKRESINPDKLKEQIKAYKSFYSACKEAIEELISIHGRKINEDHINEFFQRSSIICESLNEESQKYILMYKKLFTLSEKLNDFKNKVKKDYEDLENKILKQETLEFIYREYQSKLLESGDYDFDDMILEVIKHFKNNPNFLMKLQEKYQYILLDEYQDCNGSQNEIINFLTSHDKENANIFVVGDDDQSIYRFQGASLENIYDFYRHFGTNTQTIVLEQNYRSQQKILNAASYLIEFNEDRVCNFDKSINKKLQAVNTKLEEQAIEIHEHLNQEEQYFFLAENIKNLIESGTAAAQIAVLTRNNAELAAIANLLEHYNLAFKNHAYENILDDIFISQLIDLLRIIHKPKSHKHLIFTLLQYDFIRSSTHLAAFKCEDIWELQKLDRDLEEKNLIEIMLEHSKFKTLAQLINKAHQKSFNIPLDALFEFIINEFNYLGFALQRSDSLSRVQKINALFNEIKDLLSSNKNSTKFKAENYQLFNLEDLINYIDSLKDNKLSLNYQSSESNLDAVQLMTSHKSKGLEFEHVFIINCQDKTWGKGRNIDRIKLPIIHSGEFEIQNEQKRVEEERRLFFVAMTRAKSKLYLNHFKRDMQAKEVSVSMFIQEIISAAKAHENDYSQTITVVDHCKDKDQDSQVKAKQIALMMQGSQVNQEKLNESFIEKLLENYKLSVTHLNTFLKCARKFYYQHLLRLPSAKNKHASFGTAVHSALYELFSKILSQVCGKSNNKIIMPPKESNEYLRIESELIKSYEWALQKESLETKDYEDCLEKGKKDLKNYLEHYFSSLITDTLLEFNHQSIEYDGLKLTGKLDKIEILDPISKTINVVDYKTGNPSSKGPELKAGGSYHRQIAFYELLCKTANKTANFPYQMRTGEIDFIEADKNGNYKKAKIEINDEDKINLQKELTIFKSHLKDKSFHKTDETKLCEDCQFKNICFQ